MSKPLVSASIAAPGFFGLNTQESSVTLEDGYALEATNCIIDKYGRLGARKGYVNTTSAIGNININGITAMNRASEVDFVKFTPTSGTPPFTGNYDIVFDENHGYTIGQTVEVVNVITDFGPISGYVTLPAGETTYTFTVVDSFTLRAVDYTAGPNATRIDGDPPVVAFVSPAVPYLDGIHRHVRIDGSDVLITFGEQDDPVAPPGDFGFYQYTPDSSFSALLPIPTLTSNTGTERKFAGVTLNDKAFFFQEGFYPMQYGGHPTSGILLGDIEANYADYINPSTGSAFTSAALYRPYIPQAGVALSAYGRIWCARTATDKLTVHWSDLLDGSNWIGGSSGSIDLSAILVNGGDEITGLGAQNGRLIVFLRNSIVIFADSTGGSSLDPATLALVEVINRVGCVARDSIQNTGTDIIFLSEDGLRSLGRVIQEKSQPMRDLSANIRDELVKTIIGIDPDTIKSVYSEDNAFYLLLLPAYNRIYCFDTRTSLPNGALRVTIWENQTQGSMLATPNRVIFAGTNGLSEYRGYLDGTDTYSMRYLTNYFDLGSPTQTKILKKLNVTVIGLVEQDFIIKTALDYFDSYRSYTTKLTGAVGSEYNEAEYGLNNTVLSGSQTSSTITVGTGEHYIADFQTSQNSTYTVPLPLWLDSNTYYYSNDNGTRTQTIVYTQKNNYTFEYSVGTVSEKVNSSIGGAGSVFQVGFETIIGGSEFSIQKIDVYAKQGRVI